MQQTISITRALSKLKLLDAQISQAISSGVYVGVAIGTGDNKKYINPAIPITEVETQISSSYQKVTDLVEQRRKLKAAIVMSNATTKVTLNNLEYTVAELIELKGTVGQKQQFLQVLRQQYSAAMSSVNQLQSQLDNQINAAMQTVYSNEKGKVEQSQFDAVATPLKNTKTPSLVDPIKITEKIEIENNLVSNLVSEIDFTLSESNAKTMITI